MNSLGSIVCAGALWGHSGSMDIHLSERTQHGCTFISSQAGPHGNKRKIMWKVDVSQGLDLSRRKQVRQGNSSTQRTDYSA